MTTFPLARDINAMDVLQHPRGDFPGVQIVTNVENDTREGWIRITTDQATYVVPEWYPMAMPCRPDGEPQVYDAPVRRTFDLCIGDTVRYLGEEFTIMRVEQQADKPSSVIITTMTKSGDQHRTPSDLYVSFIPRKDEIKPIVRQSDRDARPIRGPYTDPERPGVMYRFHVHPYGAGRWPSDMPPFRREEQPGEYVTRPPQEGRKRAWSFLKFEGDDVQMRHPYDPVVRKMHRSGQWAIYKLSRGRQP